MEITVGWDPVTKVGVVAFMRSDPEVQRVHKQLKASAKRLRFVIMLRALRADATFELSEGGGTGGGSAAGSAVSAAAASGTLLAWQCDTDMLLEETTDDLVADLEGGDYGTIDAAGDKGAAGKKVDGTELRYYAVQFMSAPYVLEHRSPSEEAPADEPPEEAAAWAEPEDALAAQRAAAQRLRERAEKMREAREARTG